MTGCAAFGGAVLLFGKACKKTQKGKILKKPLFAVDKPYQYEYYFVIADGAIYFTGA